MKPSTDESAISARSELAPIESCAHLTGKPARWKRGLDLVCCAFAMPAFALLSVTIIIFSRFTSPGPLFFKQERVGRNGRRFNLYKFRTMRAGAETRSHEEHVIQLLRSNQTMQKLDARGDSRLIPGGWILRASGLDELPQIINVLRGEMSIVGPRPCLICEFDQYTPAQRERFASTPGLTGLWQVSGKNSTTFQQMVEFDIAYTRTQSLSLDLQIIARTIPTLLDQVLQAARRHIQKENTHQRQPVVRIASEPLTSPALSRYRN